MNYDDLQIIAVDTIVNRDVLNTTESHEYLRIMRSNMVNALAQAIIDNDIGEIEERYDIERMGNVYTFYLRYLPANKP